MYKRIETEKNIEWGSGNISTRVVPVVTLKNQYGHHIQIIIHENSYIILLEQKDGKYSHTAWIYPEVLEILRTLPNPQTCNRRSI